MALNYRNIAGFRNRSTEGLRRRPRRRIVAAEVPAERAAAAQSPDFATETNNSV